MADFSRDFKFLIVLANLAFS